MLLLGDQGVRRRLECPGRLGPGEEVDVDAADTARAELDVAGTAPVVCARLLAALALAISDAATTRAAPSANTPAFGTPMSATSPIA